MMRDNLQKQGLVYLFTGDGKGKTSAALGCAVRAVGHGKRVAMVQWYKERRWKIGEHTLPAKLPGLEIYPMGRGFYQLPTDHATPAKHRQAAQQALDLAAKLLSDSAASSPLFLLILDEVINAVSDDLTDIKQIVDLLAHRGATHIILTGRNASRNLIDLADLVTDMKNLKHPYEKGKKAILGLDF